MQLRIITYQLAGLGVKAVVGLYGTDGQEVYRNEVKLWNAESRKKFIDSAIRSANGNLNDIQRADFKKTWDEELRNTETKIKSKLSQERLQKENAPQADKPKELNESEREQAQALLQNPALLFQVHETVKQLGIVGEEKNVLVAYLVMTSRLLPRPISSATKGESAAGKSALDETIRKLFPENEAFYFWSSVSRQVLIYSDKDYRQKMLVFAESVGARGAEYYIRTILSEHRLVFEVTEKDPETGQSFTRRIEKEGPTGFITTTTLPNLHPENETRLITLAIDESPEQTERIKDATAAEFEDERVAPDLTAWVNAQRILEPVSVKIPYARYILKTLPNKPVRMRRDCKKLLCFIAASTVLHQYQRDKTESGEVVANLTDYFVAKVLFEDVFFQSLYGVHPNTAELMEAIVRRDGLNPGKPIIARDLMNCLGWTKDKVHKWAKPLKPYDWVEGNGGGKEYYFKVGTDPRQAVRRLPDVEELAERFPELAAQFTIVHPLTGETLNLADDTQSTNNRPESNDPGDGYQPTTP